MEITEWEEAWRMGVRHVGPVEGTGAFTLDDLGCDRSKLKWEEDLVFPWFISGPIGASFA